MGLPMLKVVCAVVGLCAVTLLVGTLATGDAHDVASMPLAVGSTQPPEDPSWSEEPRPAEGLVGTGTNAPAKHEPSNAMRSDAIQAKDSSPDVVSEIEAYEDVASVGDVVFVDGAEEIHEDPSPYEMPKDEEVEPQVVLLQIDSQASAQQVSDALMCVGGVSTPDVSQEQVERGLVRVELDESTAMERVMGELELLSGVRSVQPNYVYSASDLLDDGMARDEGGLDHFAAEDMVQASEEQGIVVQDEGAMPEEEDLTIEEGPISPIEVVPSDGRSEEEDGLLEKAPCVEIVEQGSTVGAEARSVEVNDARSDGQWALTSMQVREAWALARSNREVTVAVIDMGFDVSHEDLAKNVVAPYNSYYKSEGKDGLVTNVSSNNRHGTHVAGIVSAVANNRLGVAGISYNARIMPICAASSSGIVTSESLYRAFERAIDLAQEYNVRVINASVGSDKASLKETLEGIIQKATAAGIVTVGSAGNLGDTSGLTSAYEHYPSDIEGVVGVIDLEQRGDGVRKSSTSNYNRNKYDNKNICAPGTDILSTVPGSYAYMSGTSMAAPHVAGVLAMQFAAKPTLSADQAVETLYATTVDLGTDGWDKAYGWGEANAFYAVLGTLKGIDASKAAMVRDQEARRVKALNEAATNSLGLRAYLRGSGWQGWKKGGQSAGTTAGSKQVEALRARLKNPPYEGGVEYRTLVHGLGWQAWSKDGDASGRPGKSRYVEAVQMRLTGPMAKKYDLWYRVRSESFGSLGWAKNGARAGTSTFSKGILSFEARILPKGATAPGSTKKAYVTRLVGYRTHVQGTGWQGWRYDGSTGGTVGKGKRIEAVCIRLSDPWYGGEIQYRAYVQKKGWQSWRSNGALAGTSGKSLRIEAVRIRLTGKMADKYDVWYRVHAQTFGWLGWACNGSKAGTAGLSKRLEGVQVRLVKKGSAPPGSTARPFRQ